MYFLDLTAEEKFLSLYNLYLKFMSLLNKNSKNRFQGYARFFFPGFLKLETKPVGAIARKNVSILF